MDLNLTQQDQQAIRAHAGVTHNTKSGLFTFGLHSKFFRLMPDPVSRVKCQHVNGWTRVIWSDSARNKYTCTEGHFPSYECLSVPVILFLAFSTASNGSPSLFIVHGQIRQKKYAEKTFKTWKIKFTNGALQIVGRLKTVLFQVEFNQVTLWDSTYKVIKCSFSMVYYTAQYFG